MSERYTSVNGLELDEAKLEGEVESQGNGESGAAQWPAPEVVLDVTIESGSKAA